VVGLQKTSQMELLEAFFQFLGLPPLKDQLKLIGFNLWGYKISLHMANSPNDVFKMTFEEAGQIGEAAYDEEGNIIIDDKTSETIWDSVFYGTSKFLVHTEAFPEDAPILTKLTEQLKLIKKSYAPNNPLDLEDKKKIKYALFVLNLELPSDIEEKLIKGASFDSDIYWLTSYTNYARWFQESDFQKRAQIIEGIKLYYKDKSGHNLGRDSFLRLFAGYILTPPSYWKNVFTYMIGSLHIAEVKNFIDQNKADKTDELFKWMEQHPLIFDPKIFYGEHTIKVAKFFIQTILPPTLKDYLSKFELIDHTNKAGVRITQYIQWIQDLPFDKRKEALQYLTQAWENNPNLTVEQCWNILAIAASIPAYDETLSVEDLSAMRQNLMENILKKESSSEKLLSFLQITRSNFIQNKKMALLASRYSTEKNLMVLNLGVKLASGNFIPNDEENAEVKSALFKVLYLNPDEIRFLFSNISAVLNPFKKWLISHKDQKLEDELIRKIFHRITFFGYHIYDQKLRDIFLEEIDTIDDSDLKIFSNKLTKYNDDEQKKRELSSVVEKLTTAGTPISFKAVLAVLN
jgi:hypothetical protein